MNNEQSSIFFNIHNFFLNLNLYVYSKQEWPHEVSIMVMWDLNEGKWE